MELGTLGTTVGSRLAALTCDSGFITLFRISPVGSLQARREKSGGVSFHWRYSFKKRDERVRIGAYDSKLPPKSLSAQNGRFSVSAARRFAEQLAISHVEALNSDGSYPGLKAARATALKQQAEAEKRNAEEAAASARAALQADEEERLQNLKALCDAYVELLRRHGKPSANDAENIFKNHVIEAFPSHANTAANRIAVMDVAEMLRSLNEAGKGRTANKLRSYLGSAYNNALRAQLDPSVPASFKAFNVSANPVTSTFRIRSADRSAKAPLPVADLRAYWLAIKDLDGVQGAVLRLHVLTGGQRISQLVRLKRDDDFGDRVRLVDTKGRRSTPRSHFVPLVPQARKDLDYLKQSVKGAFLCSTTNGEKPINPLTVTRWAADVAARSQISAFTAKKIRSSVETLLASARVSSDVRGQLQSHGLGGVQQRHYDDHDYHGEKLQALQTLTRLLRATPQDNPTRVPDRNRAFRPRRSTDVQHRSTAVMESAGVASAADFAR